MEKPYADSHQTRVARLSTSHIDAAILVLTAPFLLGAARIPQAISMVTIVGLAVPFAVRRIREGRFTRQTALNLAVAVLAFGFLPAAMLVSPAPWAITWPRVAALAWSMALFFAVVNWPQPPRLRNGRRRTRLNTPTKVFLGLGGLIALVAPFVMRSVDKLFYLPQTGWLAARLGWESGWPTNEIAGVLTLFVPFTCAVAVGAFLTGRRRTLLATAPLLALQLVALILAQSRTGLTAGAAGIVVALIVGMRPKMKWIAVILGVIGVVVLALVLSPLRDWFVFAGANSWQSVISPRMGIWGQATDGIRDHPIWGMGLGVFGSMARFVYPLIPPANASAIEDAHNLYFQTALDFGVLGALLLVLMLGLAGVAALNLARGRPRRSLSALWAAGLLGSLVAHALYGLTDAVSLGTPGGVALWFVFGLIMGGTAPISREERYVNPLLTWIPIVLGIAAIAFLAVLVWSALPVNRAGQLVTRVLLSPSTETGVAEDFAGLTATRCRAGWYEGLAHHAVGNAAGRTAAWSDLLGCTPDYTGYMAQLVPDDADLARLAITKQPQNPAVYFWLAAIQADPDPVEAIALYRQGLALAPDDGPRWLELARLLSSLEDESALDAYLQACLNGDPGANGCGRAASIVEARGDLPTAIRYLRLSHWSEARQRADELERRLAGE